MNDHNLDDLIIDNIEPNQNKTKSFLTILALLIVFLIVGIILAKSYTDEPSNAILESKETHSEIVAPELTLQAPAKVAKTQEELSLSTIIEEEIKAPQETINTIETIEDLALEAESTTPVVAKQESVAKKSIKKEPIVEKPVKIKKETVQITQEFTQKPKVEKVKEPVKKPVKEPAKTTPKPKHVTKTFPHGTYFIQVGSFSQVPSSRFLSVIQKSGFKYGISRANAQGIKKLLIGPYSSKASVDAALPRVRDRINKKAFVVKK